MDEESGFEFTWRMFVSPKLLVAYIVCGLVWLTVTLPNLLEVADNKWWKAIPIALWRVIAWPYLFGKAVYSFFKKDKVEPNDAEVEGEDE